MNDKNYFDMSNAQKIALLLIALGKKTASEILSRLPEEDVKEISYWIHRTTVATAEMTKNAVDEFYSRLHISPKASYSGGKGYLYEVLKESVGDEKAKNILNHIEVPGKKESPLRSILATADPKQLAEFFEKETSQAAALMLYHLDTTRTAAILSSMMLESQVAILISLIQLEDLDAAKARSLLKESSEVFDDEGMANKGFEDSAKIAFKVISLFDKEKQKELLAGIKSADQLSLIKINNLQFAYNYMLPLNEEAVAALTNNCNPLDIALSLYKLEDDEKVRFFQNMTKTTLDSINKQLADTAPVTPYSIHTAQQNILDNLQELQAVRK